MIMFTQRREGGLEDRILPWISKDKGGGGKSSGANQGEKIKRGCQCTIKVNNLLHKETKIMERRVLF